MEDKLNKVLENQEILNKNQFIIYKLLLLIEKEINSDSKEFLINYLADLTGTATTEVLKKINK